MKRTRDPHAEHQRTQLATQFDHWRQHRTTRAERIPLALWQQAVALTTVLPLARVAKRLRVSWHDLHQHCVAYHGPLSREIPPAPLNFMEVPAPPAWPLPTAGTEIELQRADGARLRIHSHEPQLPLATLVRTFLETPECSS